MTALQLSASQRIAAFAAGFKPTHLTEMHVQQCARALADTYAVALAGLNEQPAQHVLQYIATVQPALDETRYLAGRGLARLWGRGRATTVELAALHNGVAGHALDYDDASSPMSGHPSVALLPALIALGEVRGVTGLRLAAAYTVGFEVLCKLGRAMAHEHYARGWHMTSSIGTVAAAVACAYLLELDEVRIVNAIGLAVAQTAGTRENFGTDAKPFQAGQCGAAALRSVLLSETGFTASPAALDGPAGFMSMYSGGNGLTDELETLGQYPLELISSGIEIKKYPACYALHRPLDGVLDLKREHAITLSNVVHIAVETSGGALVPLIRHYPKTGTEAKFSMQYGIAAAVADGQVGLASFTDEAVQRPAIQAFLPRIEARESACAMVPRWASVSITLKDGTALQRHIDALRGASQLPLTNEELSRKLADCIAFGGSTVKPASLLEVALDMERFTVSGLLDAVERPGADRSSSVYRHKEQ